MCFINMELFIRLVIHHKNLFFCYFRSYFIRESAHAFQELTNSRHYKYQNYMFDRLQQNYRLFG